MDLGFNLMGIFVSLHGSISNFDIISASPVLASINANRRPICVEQTRYYKYIFDILMNIWNT